MSATAGGSAGEIPGIAELDLQRFARRGAAEAVLGDAKSVEQVRAIARHYAHLEGQEQLGHVLFTRCDAPRLQAIREQMPSAHVDSEARIAAWPAQAPEPTGGLVVIVSAGTSDIPVAREAELTARYLGRPTELVVDVGIAGLHRVINRLPQLRQAACIVVAAGMDGALPGVIAGLVDSPVIGLPTSVGYGVAAGGTVALHTMLATCAPGVAVVNVDNGYGAGHMAAQIARGAQGR